MPHSNRAGRVASAATAIALLLASCADDSNGRSRGGSSNVSGDRGASASPPASDGSTTESTTGSTGPAGPVSDDEAVAFGLCSALRAQANVMTEIANSAAAEIHDKSPVERYASLSDGFDRGAAASIEFRDGLGGLELPAIPELDSLIDQIAAGADAAAAEFVDEQARFAADVGGAVADDDARGRVSQLFNSIEKANSLVEPVIVRYQRVELQRAFLDEPECRYVIQQFVLDES